MGKVIYNGTPQEYHLLLPWQKMQVDEQQARELAARRAATVDEDRDLAMRSLPIEEKLTLRRAGYQGDLSELPPGPDSGRLGRTVTRSAAGHLIEEYSGDPRAWMDQFAPATKMVAISFRGPHTSDAEWEQTMARRFDHWQAQNPGIVASSPHQLMRSA